MSTKIHPSFFLTLGVLFGTILSIKTMEIEKKQEKTQRYFQRISTQIGSFTIKEADEDVSLYDNKYFVPIEKSCWEKFCEKICCQKPINYDSIVLRISETTVVPFHQVMLTIQRLKNIEHVSPYILAKIVFLAKHPKQKLQQDVLLGYLEKLLKNNITINSWLNSDGSLRSHIAFMVNIAVKESNKMLIVLSQKQMIDKLINRRLLCKIIGI